MAADPKMPAPASPATEPKAGYIAKLGGKVRKFKSERDEARTKLAALEKELADLKAKPVDKTAVQLQAELREIKHRATFDKLATDLKARPEALDDLWKLSGYMPETDAVDEAALKGLISEQAKTRGYLFDGAAPPAPGAAGKQPAPRIEPGPGNSRGGLVRDSGKFQVRRKGEGSVRDPVWMQQNQKAYYEAVKTGSVEYID